MVLFAVLVAATVLVALVQLPATLKGDGLGHRQPPASEPHWADGSPLAAGLPTGPRIRGLV
ncbi:hypothetical protein AB6N24_14890 [Cellulomonas sp. 179-A 4D5 NHS]|uniref:hypothetical protein n=1 Tax=Cellulomonas sp. 179-A 4D5 NHS TaxID=3142378 RepID=UPI0039A0771B